MGPNNEFAYPSFAFVDFYTSNQHDWVLFIEMKF